MIKQQKSSLAFTIKNAIDESLSNTHTSTIAKVTKITGATISVKPVFKRVVDNIEIELPEFVEVPILTLQGGSNYRIMPISTGDTVLLVFNERCIDDWYQGADNKKPREYRMHDYSDAIAIVGLNNISNAINIPTGHEEVQGDINHTGNLTQTGNIDLTGDATAINITAALYKTGALSGATGTFTTADSKTVTVNSGIITSIV